MKKSLFLSIVLLYLAFAQTGFSQSPDWTPIFLTASGHHVKYGVEAYYQRATCGTDEVIFIKFVNTNNHPVKLEWYNAVFTHDITWVHNNNQLFSLTVPASSGNTGECSGEAVLMVQLSDFIADAAKFKRFSTSQLTVTAQN
jgi:hypothetical protein